MAEPLEVTEARVDEQALQLAEVQDERDRRVREGDDNPDNLLFVAGEIVAAKRGFRKLRADLARLSHHLEKGGD